MSGLVLVVFAVLAGGMIYYGWVQEKKRLEALSRLAAELGFVFEPDKDTTRRGGRYDQIDLLTKGSNRFTQNHLVGQVEGRQVIACDFHDETYSNNHKGHRQTHHHYFGIVFIEIPLRMSQVCIRGENILDKLAGALGFEDIDFESAEFSRRFHVSAKERKFAYDLIHPRAMEYLLDHDSYSWEFDGTVIALYQSSRFKPEAIQSAIQTAIGFIPLIPEYVLAERSRPNATEK